MKVILKPKEFAVIKAKASGKTPVFQENHPLAHNADFQRKILLKQKRYSFFQGNFPAGRYASFGMLKRMKVYTQVVKNCSTKELLPILRRFSDLSESVIYLDYWNTNERLVYYGAKEHFRVKHLKSEFANDKFHINVIVNVFTSLCS